MEDAHSLSKDEAREQRGCRDVVIGKDKVEIDWK